LLLYRNKKINSGKKYKKILVKRSRKEKKNSLIYCRERIFLFNFIVLDSQMMKLIAKKNGNRNGFGMVKCGVECGTFS
jgi:hypothetical protein